MKKLFFCAVALASMTTTAMAQDDPDSKYIRNSVYMMKLDEQSNDAEYAQAYKIMNESFDEINFDTRYERYNNFSLANRHFDLASLPSVTQAEADAIGKETMIQKQVREYLVQNGFKSSDLNPFETAAKIKKQLEADKYANKLVAKWHIPAGASYDNVEAWDPTLAVIMELGCKGLSEEARANAIASSNLQAVAGNSENKLLSNSYICVNHYRYVTAEERIATITTPMEIAISQLPAIAQVAAKLTIETIKKKVKGYSVKTNAYLFRLKWDPTLQEEFYTKYWENPADFANANYELEYVGKSSKFAGASMSLKASANVDAMTKQATLRGTDAAFAALQRDYEVFRPMSSLHVVDGKLAAYIGMKEAVQEGDEFEVLQPVEDKEGQIDWKKVGSIKVAKKSVWDNREKVAGADGAEAAAGDDEAENTSLSCTFFDGKPGKMGEGCMIRLSKPKKSK